MTNLTTQQLEDFRIDLDLPVNAVFTDAELNRFYARASEDYDTAKVYALRALLASAAKLHDYKAGQSSESLSQVVDNMRKNLRDMESNAGMGGAVISVGNFSLNIDASETNATEWGGDYDDTY